MTLLAPRFLAGPALPAAGPATRSVHVTTKLEPGAHQDATTAAAELSAVFQIAKALAPLSPEARRRVLARLVQETAPDTALLGDDDT